MRLRGGGGLVGPLVKGGFAVSYISEPVGTAAQCPEE